MELLLIPAPDTSGKAFCVPAEKSSPGQSKHGGPACLRVPTGVHNYVILFCSLGSSGLVVKTALKLLLVFVEYSESNAPLLIQAVSAVDTKRGKWSHSLFHRGGHVCWRRAPVFNMLETGLRMSRIPFVRTPC